VHSHHLPSAPLCCVVSCCAVLCCAVSHRIITDVLRAVAQCHAKGVLLRDVKPDNFL
jgi:serine/threonine protein kinase